MKISNFFYVFDSETTNINDEYAVCYLYGIKKYNYSLNINDDNLKDFAEKYTYFQNSVDFANYLKEINENAKNKNEYTYIYIQNLIFDLYELLQNIFDKFNITKKIRDNTLNKSIFRGSASKPLIFYFDHLIFIDSLALTNKSLAKISNNHKIKKLIELKTYKEKYFFGSKLPKTELLYNENDLDVTALGVFDSIKSCKKDFKTFQDFANCKINTVTGISKFLNKNVSNDENYNNSNVNIHTKRASNNLPKVNGEIDIDTILLFQKVFGGGFTHANPFIAYSFFKSYGIFSFDKKSHYPATMLCRRFPTGIEKVNNFDLVLKMHIENLLFTDLLNYDKFIFNMLNNNLDFKKSSYFTPLKYNFLGLFELKDINIKIFNKNNIMPLIAISQCIIDENNFKSIVADNGKILKANKLKVYATSIDLLTFSMFYDFKITNSESVFYFSKNKFLDRYIQDSLRYHLVNKDELSKCIKGDKNINDLTIFDGSKMYNENAIKNFNSMTNEEQQDFLNAEYMATKTNGINNQYGINVQKIVNDEISFDFDIYDFVKKENVLQGIKNGQTTRDFLSGLYITAYARLDLALITYMIFNETNCIVAYWDTDSVKVICNSKKDRNDLEKVIKKYNNRFSKIQDKIKELFGDFFGLGIWENDGNYNDFFTLGSKKYIVRIENEIKVTNAGINKKNYSKFLTEKYQKNNDFKTVVNKYYHPNLIIGGDISGRKTVKYPHLHEHLIETELTDENGDIIKIKQYPAPLIYSGDYMLHALDNKHLANLAHFQLCCKLQNKNKNDNDIVNIKIDSIGNIKNNSDNNNYII